MKVFEYDFDKLSGEKEIRLLTAILDAGNYYCLEPYWYRKYNYLIVIKISKKDYDYIMDFYKKNDLDLLKYYKIKFEFKD